MGIDDGLPRISSASPAEWKRWLEGRHAVCGRWDAPYEGRRRSTVPDDLRRELDARPGARACFDELDSQNR